MELPSTLLRLSSKKFLYFFIFRKIELSGSNSKKFLAFSYILGNVNPVKKNIFQETETLKKVSMFQEVPF